MPLTEPAYHRPMGSPGPHPQSSPIGGAPTKLARAIRHAERFRQVIHQRTGIHLSEAKDTMIETRLRSRFVALGLPGVDAYFRHLFRDGGLEAEMPRILELVTTNKTDFFRERAHFDLLQDRMSSRALRRFTPGRRVTFKLWSAAASTGAEAWSAAMVLAAAQERHPGLDWNVLGTDLSRRVLETARQAIYPDEALAPVPAELCDRYAIRIHGPDGASMRQIAPLLRGRVRFAEMNLMDRPYPVDHQLDAIFLRNVLIYFDPPTQAGVLAAMASHLRPGGHLVVGHSESMTVRLRGLRRVAPAVFERIPEGEGPR